MGCSPGPEREHQNGRNVFIERCDKTQKLKTHEGDRETERGGRDRGVTERGRGGWRGGQKKRETARERETEDKKWD